MHGPQSVAWLLVALCSAGGAYCLLRMRSTVAAQRGTAGGDALMGFAMAAMAVPAAVLTPPRWVWLVCAAVFCGAALRAAWSARRERHHLHHLVGACAMVHMSVAMASMPASHLGHHRTGGGAALLTGALLVYFAGHALWAGARLVPVAAAATAGAGGGTVGWGDRPELARACRLSMSMGMLAMLLTM